METMQHKAVLNMADISDDEMPDELNVPVKLTDWANEPAVSVLVDDLQAARPSHQSHISNINRWNNLLLVQGESKPKKKAGRSSIQPKLVRRQAEWRYPALSEPLLSSDRLFEVEPQSFEDVDVARQTELILNYQFRTKLDRVKFVDDLVRTLVDEGSAIVRTGWIRTYKTAMEEVPEYALRLVQSQEEMQMLQEAMQLREQNPRGYSEQVDPAIQEAVDASEEMGQMVWAEQVGVRQVEVQKIDKNAPTADILNPANVYVDPSCQGDLDKAKFAVISFETSQADLRAEGDRYHNLDVVPWDQLSVATETEHESQTPHDFNFKDPMRKRVVAYEYWGYYDIDNTGELKPIVATWVGNVMIRMELNPFPDEKIPLVIVNYLPVKRGLYGEPDAELLEDNQKVLGALMRGMIDLLGRSANSQTAIPKGFLDAVNQRRYENGEDFQYNAINGMHPETALYMMKYPEFPTSAVTMLQFQNQEAEALTGVKSFTGGITGEAYGDVAAGIRGVLDAASKREMGILRRVANGLTKIALKFAKMNLVFLSEQEIVRLTNKEFVVIKREDLKGDYDIVVDIATAEVDNAKAQDLGFMLQTLGNTLPWQITRDILADIARLKRMPALEEAIRRYEPQPDPLEERLKELEIEEKQATIEKLRAETARANAEAQLKTATSVKTHVDVLEQETGTKHERDMEKMRAQGEANAALEITKGLLKPTKQGEQSPNVDAAIGWNTLSEAAKRGVDPRQNLRSKHYDPSQDPAMRPGMRL